MKEKRKNNGIIVAAMIFIVSCVGLYTFIYVIPSISGALTRTAVIAYGNLQVRDEASCFIIRDEMIVTAKQSGSISYYIDEGSKTRKSTKVLDIYPSGATSSSYNCYATGVVSYFIDGYEDYFTKANIEKMQPAKLVELNITPENTKRTNVSVGEPIYKLILDDVWYILLLVSEENIGKYEVDSSVLIEFEDGKVEGTTTQLLQKDEGWLAVVEVDRYYEGFARVRQAEVVAITKDYQGLIIPNTAIGQEEGLSGVYVRKLDGDFSFARIKVITTDGKDSLIESSYFYDTDSAGLQTKIKTVDIYDEILRNADSGE